MGYVYDSVGNRKQMTSTVPGLPAGLWNYDVNDRLASDVYDADGNTVSSGGLNYVYDFENHLVQQGGATFVYDGDGNRVQKIVAGNVTHYFVDTVNPTGYAQVLGEETTSNFVNVGYVWGLDLIFRGPFSGPQSYYVHDGHGSVRALTNTSGAVTDTYDYDAFGNLLHSTGTTPNNYLFASQQFDPNLNLYYNRARYLSTTTGRFWSMDSYEGNARDPLSLNKYVYTEEDPTNNVDSSGNEIDAVGSLALASTLGALPQLNAQALAAQIRAGLRDDPNDLWLVPKEDLQIFGQKATFWQPARPPERSILYVLERKDGKPLKNPAYNWTVSEHQTNAPVAREANGTSHEDGGRFCDDLSPLLQKTPIQSTQSFTISPQPGVYKAANENRDVIVHTQNGDFDKLGTWMDDHAVLINGLAKWTGTLENACQ